MQTQHLIIIAVGQLTGLALLAYFIRRAFLRALARATADDRDRIYALNNDLARAVGCREELKKQLGDHDTRQRQLKAQPFTLEDHQTLSNDTTRNTSTSWPGKLSAWQKRRSTPAHPSSPHWLLISGPSLKSQRRSGPADLVQGYRLA